MKRAWILTLGLAAALPLFADEPKSEPKKSAKPEQTKAASSTTATKAKATEDAAPAATTDSPLVAASKRANRRGRAKSATVITNETLSKSGANAHLTTTDTQHEIVMPGPVAPPAPTPEMVYAEKVANAAKEQADKDAAAAKVRAAEAEATAKKAAAAEDGFNGGQGDDADELTGTEEKPPLH